MLSEFEKHLFAKLALKKGEREDAEELMSCPSCSNSEFVIIDCEVYCSVCQQCVDPSLEIEEE